MIVGIEKLEGCKPITKQFVAWLEGIYPKNVIIVNSGFRAKEQNKCAGGTKTSQHLKGLAVDIRVSNIMCLEVLARVITEKLSVRGVGIDIFKDYCHFDFRPQKHISIWVYGRDGKVI